MKIDILSLFPEMFEGFLNTSIIKRAIDKEVVDIKIHNYLPCFESANFFMIPCLDNKFLTVSDG